MTHFLHDLLRAFRTLFKSPAFTLPAVLTLALGIGATTALFSLVDRVLLHPLPFPAADRLVVLRSCKPSQMDQAPELTYPNFRDFQTRSRSLASLAAMTNGSANLTGDGDAVRLQVGRVSWTFLDVLGVSPARGRGFRPDDDQSGRPRVAILDHAFWQSRFGGDPGVVGRTLRLDGKPTEVIGVMPAGFQCPYAIQGVELYVPLALSPERAEARGDWYLSVLGRLRPGVSLKEAETEIETLAQALEQAHPEANADTSARLVPLQEEVVRDTRSTLLALFGATGFVLLIACANVGNLLLARNAGRERELAVRTALGASRWQLLRHFLAEALALSLLSGAAGLLVAGLSADALQALLFLDVPHPPRLDAVQILFVLLCSGAIAFAFMVLPALHAGRVESLEGLRDGAKGSSGPAQRRLRNALVVVEVALATSLLVGTGHMVKVLWRLQHVDPGFQARQRLTASLTLPEGTYRDLAAEQGLEANLLARLSALPGVESATLTTTLPLSGSTTSSAYQIEGEPSPRVRPVAVYHWVTPGYFRTLGIPLRQGRDFDVRDTQSAVISERFARSRWPGQDPIGKRFSVGGDQGPWLSVIGVAADVHQQSLAEVPGVAFYLSLLDPSGEGGPRDLKLTTVLHTAGKPEGWIPALRGVLRELDPDVPVGRVRSLEAGVARYLVHSRSQTLLFGLFGALALVLAALGIYGVTRFLVTQRTREIGIRVALGARVREVVRMILAQGLVSVALGLVLGLVGARGLGRVIQNQVGKAGAQDPEVLVAAVVLLLLVAFLACLIPALRAARIPPTEALRNE
jgi:putative ABC transport system permease protein